MLKIMERFIIISFCVLLFLHGNAAATTQEPTGPPTPNTTTSTTSTTTLISTSTSTSLPTTSTTTSTTSSTTQATPNENCDIIHYMSNNTGRLFNGLQYTNNTEVDLSNCSFVYPLLATVFDQAFQIYFYNILDFNPSSVRLYARKEVPVGVYINITFKAKDSYNRNKTIAITITAISENDPPMFVGLQSTFDVAENTAVGTNVYLVTILDPDVGDAGLINLSTNSSFPRATKDNGSAVLWFQHLELIKPIDADTFQRNTSHMYGPIEVISVRASDPLGLYTEATISMTVRDVDDNAAVCQPEVTLYLSSSTNRKVYIVGDLNTYCVDRDYTPANRVINFTVVMENCTRYGVEASSLLFTQNNILFANSTLLTQQRPCRVNISAGNESHRTSFLVNIRFSECPADTDFANTKWPPGRLGYTEKMNCPGHYNGSILRNCSASGVYEEPKYLCTADDIGIIYQQILNGGNISTILKNLSTATSTTEKPTGLSVGDIETSGQILDGIIERINASDSLWSNTTDVSYDGHYMLLISNKRGNL